MKICRVMILSLLLTVLSLSMGMAAVPNIQQILGNTCQGVTVNSAPASGSSSVLSYFLSVDPNASFNGNNVITVDTLIIYPNAGNYHPGPVSMSQGYSALDAKAGSYDTMNNGFEFLYKRLPVLNGVKSGTHCQIGNATYTSDTMPQDQIFAVHLFYRSNETNYVLDTYAVANQQSTNEILQRKVSPVPEPGTLTFLVLGIIPIAGLVRKMKY